MNLNQNKRRGLILLVTGLALIGWGITQLLAPAQYRATVRVKLGGTDIDSIPAELETMRSQLILDHAIAAAGLVRDWNDRYGGGKTLSDAEVRRMLLERLHLRQLRGTVVIEIRATSEQQDEPARIANAVATAYRDYRRGLREKLVSDSLLPLEEKLDREIRQIIEVQTQMHQVHVDLETPDSSSTTGKLEAYYELTRQLQELQRSQVSLQSQVAKERVRHRLSGFTVADILNTASPPRHPHSARRDFGMGLIGIGALLGAGGGWFLKKPRAKKPAPLKAR